MAESAMEWDLAPLVASTETESLKKQLDSLVIEAEQIAVDYKGRVTTLDAEEFLVFLKRLETHMLEREGALKYANLKYAANSLDPQAKEISDWGRTAHMKLRQTLAFAEVEGSHLIDKKRELMGSSTLAEYRHFLERLLQRAPHYLSDSEERLAIQKDRFGIDSWYQLQQDWLSTRTFDIEIEGEMKVMPYGEIIGLYEHSDRHVREEANRVVYAGLGQDDIIWASALRAVLGDHLEMCKDRDWSSPLAPSLIDNDVDEETINALMRTVESHVSMYRRYLRLKARLMNLPRLANYDLVAPLPDMPDRIFSWEEARSLVVQAYSELDPVIASIVADMFESRRIDGEVRSGKRSGAFCSSWFSGEAAFILLSFNGRLGEVFTLAHENGHAVHATLMARSQTMMNYEIGACVAETASIFGELLLADKLISQAETAAEKREVLTQVLDGFGYAVFQVSARFLFERWLYEAISRGEYLDGETISEYWTKARGKIYGDSVEWMDEMSWEWTMKPHYYLPRFRYYNYPYVYANLFVFALYRTYQEEGSKFAPKLVELLSAGSSRSPRDLGASLGFDITTSEFWELGMNQADILIDELESLV